ncbi:MAG: hypothetical protein KAS30_05310, partial [Candidatus Diapherotrites archaeon]|nr:hypothetical protein [Candidatus Diapherotrites archaeon]
MKESKLQSKMVVEFSQQRPNEKGCLWSTRNTTLSVKDGQKQKAMGMIAGVSDLIYFKDGCLIGIEVKFPGKEHKFGHVLQQYNWGTKITSEGGKWYVVTSIEGFWAVINGKPTHENVYSLHEVKMLLEQ